MKNNLLFHSLSITKVISTICFLILIISGTHIFNVLSVFNEQAINNAEISRLSNLKHAINTIVVESKYTRKGLKGSLNNLLPLLSDKKVENRIFNVDEINALNLELGKDLSRLQRHLHQLSKYRLEYRLDRFSKKVTTTIDQYKFLLKKEFYLLKLSEVIAFTLIAICSIFLLFYCRKYIVYPLKTLDSNVTSIANHRFDVQFPEHRNEIGVLSTGMRSMSTELESLIIAMQRKVFEKTAELEGANEKVQFLYKISLQLSTVKLTHPIILDTLNALAKQTNLTKLCLELVNGVEIDSEHGCAKNQKAMKRIPIIINGKPFGYLNYVQPIAVADDENIIASFSSLLTRALYQEEYSLREQKLLLMEERGIIARELHDSIAQALSFLKIQCTVLRRQIEVDTDKGQSIESVNNIEEAVSDAYVQLRSLLSTFRLNISVSDLKEAVLIMISQLQKQTTSKITLGTFESNFQTHANQHIHLLQIVREAITNAMKHANCNNITINCVIVENQVIISVIDDGIGIKSKPGKANHYGLEIMNQRAAELDAELEIKQLPVGTEIRLIFSI